MPCTPGVFGDGAHDLLAGQVHHLYLGAVREVEALAGRVHAEVVPAALAADGDGVEQAVGRGGRGGLGQRRAGERQGRASVAANKRIFMVSK